MIIYGRQRRGEKLHHLEYHSAYRRDGLPIRRCRVIMYYYYYVRENYLGKNLGKRLTRGRDATQSFPLK